MEKKDGVLVKASMAYLIGNIFDKAIAFITVPIFTRLLSSLYLRIYHGKVS